MTTNRYTNLTDAQLSILDSFLDGDLLDNYIDLLLTVQDDLLAATEPKVLSDKETCEEWDKLMSLRNLRLDLEELKKHFES